MVNEKYKNAFSEVSVILEHIRKEDYDKISEDVIKAINENKNNDYVFELENGIELKDQNLMPETRALLFNLYYDYYADENQKQIIQDIWRVQNRKEDLEKQGKYDLNVFKKENHNINISDSSNTSNNSNDSNDSNISDIKSENSENIENSKNNENNDYTKQIQIAEKKENIFIRVLKMIKNVFGIK